MRLVFAQHPGGGTGHDSINGGSGVDTLVFLSGTGARTVNLSLTGAQSTAEGTDTITSIENVVGDAGNDTLIGSTAASCCSFLSY